MISSRFLNKNYFFQNNITTSKFLLQFIINKELILNNDFFIQYLNKEASYDFSMI